MKKIIKIFLFISILSNANSQDFYIDNGFVRYLDGISSDWEDLNINEAYEFLSRSDFKDIKKSSGLDLEYLTGKISFKAMDATVIFFRTLYFEDKVISGYSDELRYTSMCVLCFAKDMESKITAFDLPMDIAFEGDIENKKKFYDNYIKSLKKDGINLNAGQEFSRKQKITNSDTSYFDYEDTVVRGKYFIKREASLSLEGNTLYTFVMQRTIKLKPKNYFVGRIDLKGVNQYDLKYMVEVFLLDLENRSIDFNEAQSIDVSFENLEGDTFGQSYSTNNDNQIKIKIDPEKWSDASPPKRWYLLYHELGHDVLNLSHGNGGKMMFPFIDKGYSWDEFWKDKEYMLNTF